jgi:hypothetical protein
MKNVSSGRDSVNLNFLIAGNAYKQFTAHCNYSSVAESKLYLYIYIFNLQYDIFISLEVLSLHIVILSTEKYVHEPINYLSLTALATTCRVLRLVVCKLV